VSRAAGKYDWEVTEVDRGAAEPLADALGEHPIVAQILLGRGYSTPESARRFLEPSLDDLSDPFQLDDMEQAVARLKRARDHGEHVLIFGDYDVDGIAGTALLVRALGRFGMRRVSYGVPNRLIEGYGLSLDRVDAAKASGASLIVTVDNGVGAHEALARARELGIDVIVTDHHAIEGPLPGAFAVINPKRGPSNSPGHDASGSVVAFKLAWALTGERADLDLAALGAIADVVPLTGENRDLVAAGIDATAHGPRPGMAALARVANVDLAARRTDDIAYQIAPRINAGGRMGDGLAGLNLLLTDSFQEALECAEELNRANESRKALEQDTLRHALALLKGAFRSEQRSVVLAHHKWHKGVIGIVASRVQSTYYRPVVLISLDGNGVGQGSARSIAGFNVAAALANCREHLISCGGPAAAAGLTLEASRVDAFREAFEREAAHCLPPGPLRRRLAMDAQVSLSEVDSRLVKRLERLRPFGHGNPAPILCTFGVRALPDSWRELRGGHIKAAFKDGNRIYDVVGFRMAERLRSLAAAPVLDIAFSPQLNVWRDTTTLQLVLRDARPAVTGA
jgi:single-stranded-DNA-specific exonuclease